MTDRLDPRREQYAGAITEHLWGSPDQVDEATTAVMALADSERQHAEAALERVRAALPPYNMPVHGDTSRGVQMGWDRARQAVLAALDSTAQPEESATP